MDYTNLHKEIFETDITKDMSLSGPIISLKDGTPYILVSTKDSIVGRVKLDDSLKYPSLVKNEI